MTESKSSSIGLAGLGGIAMPAVAAVLSRSLFKVDFVAATVAQLNPAKDAEYGPGDSKRPAPAEPVAAKAPAPSLSVQIAPEVKSAHSAPADEAKIYRPVSVQSRHWLLCSATPSMQPLVEAIRLQDVVRVRDLLKAGADVNAMGVSQPLPRRSFECLQSDGASLHRAVERAGPGMEIFNLILNCPGVKLSLPRVRALHPASRYPLRG